MNNVYNKFYNMANEVYNAATSYESFQLKADAITQIFQRYGDNMQGFRFGTNRLSIDTPFNVNVNGTAMATVVKMPFQGAQGHIDNYYEIELSKRLQHLGIIAPSTRVLTPGSTAIIEQRKTQRFDTYDDLKRNWNLYRQFLMSCDANGVILRDARPSNFRNLGLLDGKVVSHDYAYFRYIGKPIVCPRCKSGILSYHPIDSASNKSEGYVCSNGHCEGSLQKGATVSFITPDEIITSYGINGTNGM
jgi:hypothetical protein